MFDISAMDPKMLQSYLWNSVNIFQRWHGCCRGKKNWKFSDYQKETAIVKPLWFSIEITLNDWDLWAMIPYQISRKKWKQLEHCIAKNELLFDLWSHRHYSNIDCSLTFDGIHILHYQLLPIFSKFQNQLYIGFSNQWSSNHTNAVSNKNFMIMTRWIACGLLGPCEDC